jgi:NAD-dependent deacetylase
MRMENGIQKAGRLLRDAKRILFITGAGVSAESGIPTFRGSTAAFPDGRTDQGIPFEEALSASTFRRNPRLTWRCFFQLERACRGKEPNLAHLAIAALEKGGRHVGVATQNIDGLHQQAGSTDVIELHGNLLRLICTRCEYRASACTFDGMPELPLCPECGGILRPGVVLYEELLPEGALRQLEMEQSKGFDLICSVGTTSIFPYVQEPMLIAASAGIPTVEINPEETPLSNVVDFRFPAPAGPTLEKLLRVVNLRSA